MTTKIGVPAFFISLGAIVFGLSVLSTILPVTHLSVTLTDEVVPGDRFVLTANNIEAGQCTNDPRAFKFRYLPDHEGQSAPELEAKEVAAELGSCSGHYYKLNETSFPVGLWLAEGPSEGKIKLNSSVNVIKPKINEAAELLIIFDAAVWFGGWAIACIMSILILGNRAHKKDEEQ